MNSAKNLSRISTHAPKGFLVALVSAAMLLVAPTSFAADCKGKSKSACSSNDSCSWVNSYKTKKGNSVKAFCRAKPGKGKKTAKKSSSAKSAKASTDAKRSQTTKSTKSKKTTTKSSLSSSKKSSKTTSKKTTSKSSTTKKSAKKKPSKKKTGTQ